jgi:prepilin-type processing-associated H-X9-DG protein
MQTGGNGTRCYTNWAIENLPYIEQDNLYKRYRQNEFNETANNNAVGQQRVKTYECPSDHLVGRLERPASGPHQNRPWMHGSYRAVSGRGEEVRGRGFWDTFEPELWGVPSGSVPPFPHYRGALHGTASAYNGVPAFNTVRNGVSVSSMGGPERITSITDGTSNTLFVGECTFQDVPSRATFWAYTYASYNASSVTAQSRILNNYYWKCATFSGRPGSTDWRAPGMDHTCKRAFGSNHTSGMNFGMCDGSVRFVSNNVDINMLAWMATIAGGEVTNLQ